MSPRQLEEKIAWQFGNIQMLIILSVLSVLLFVFYMLVQLEEYNRDFEEETRYLIESPEAVTSGQIHNN